MIKLSMIECKKAGYDPILTVHDELIFEDREFLADKTKRIKEVMENIVKLDVPLKADIGHGSNWLEAKGAH